MKNKDKDLQNVIIYTDGSCHKNGNGGYGAIVIYTTEEGDAYAKTLSQGYSHTTNNRMELMGVIKALETLRTPCNVDLYSDSKYIVDAFNKGWLDYWREGDEWLTSSGLPVKNRNMWEVLIRLTKIHIVHFHWVKGHSGVELNELCDILATKASASANLIMDLGEEEPLLPDDRAHPMPYPRELLKGLKDWLKQNGKTNILGKGI